MLEDSLPGRETDVPWVCTIYSAGTRGGGSGVGGTVIQSVPVWESRGITEREHVFYFQEWVVAGECMGDGHL